jgi:hypothetical protein
MNTAKQKTFQEKVDAIFKNNKFFLGSIEIKDHAHGYRVTLNAHFHDVNSYVEDSIEAALDACIINFDRDLKNKTKRDAARTLKWIQEQRDEATKREETLLQELKDAGLTLKDIPKDQD